MLYRNYVGFAIARAPLPSPGSTQFPKINLPKTKIFPTLFLHDSATTALPYALQPGVYVGRLLSRNCGGFAVARLPPSSPWGIQFPKINPLKTKIFAALSLYDGKPKALPYALQGRQGAWPSDERQSIFIQTSHNRRGSILQIQSNLFSIPIIDCATQQICTC